MAIKIFDEFGVMTNKLVNIEELVGDAPDVCQSNIGKG